MSRPFKFQLSSLMTWTFIIAILMAWRFDHTQLQRRIDDLQFAEARWDTNQVTGPPDTDQFGDIRTAWASQTPDGRQEWLLLIYDQAVTPTAVHVHETYNPGALKQVSLIDKDGHEHVVWQGLDPVPPDAKGGIARIPLRTQLSVQQVKLYLDSPAVPGWNEIDAVGLVDQRGQTTWASAAYASSSFGRNNKLPFQLRLPFSK